MHLQGNGRSTAYSIATVGSSIFAGGHAYGNLSFTSVHATNGAHGEVNNHANVGGHLNTAIHHETGTITGGRYTNAASSQHGMDGVVYKISETGIPQEVFAFDTTPSDGVLDGTGENGRWGGYNYIYRMQAFQDNRHLAVSGNFRGNITIPTVGGGHTTLTNRKSSNYDGFLIKLDTTASPMRAAWAVAPEQFAGGRSYFRSVATTAAGHVINSNDIRPGRSYQGRIIKVNGNTGATVWVKGPYADANYFYGVATIGEDTFFGAEHGTAGVTPFENGVTIPTASGSVSKLDAAGNYQWTVPLPSSEWVREIVSSPSGDAIFVYGPTPSSSSSKVASGTGACAVTGQNKAVLYRLNPADGSCVWAKDIGPMGYGRMTADATYLYGVGYEDEPITFDQDLTLRTRGAENDATLLKWRTSDGMGMWGMSIGGTGDDYGYDVALTSAGGIVIAGQTYSDTIDLGGVAVNNLQHARSEAASGTDAVNSGQRAMFVAGFAATESPPSCVTCGPSGLITDAATTISAGNCFSDGECYANGASSVYLPCFMCDAANSQTSFTGPDTTNHCYINGQCINSGASGPAYRRYHSSSVCEQCQPSVNPTGYSPTPGFIHDRVIADPGGSGRYAPAGSNIFGMMFETRSTAARCRRSPSARRPASPTRRVATAAASVVSGTIAEAGSHHPSRAQAGHEHHLSEEAQRAVAGTGIYSGVSAAARKHFINALATTGIPTKAAIDSISASSTTPTSWQTAWALYNGDEATCTKTSSQTCEHTPAAIAGNHAEAFATNLHYGHSVSAVKTMQSLALGRLPASPRTPPSRRASSLTRAPHACAVHAGCDEGRAQHEHRH